MEKKPNFIGVSATKSYEKSRNFMYGSSEDLLSKGQKTVGGFHPDPRPPPRVLPVVEFFMGWAGFG